MVLLLTKLVLNVTKIKYWAPNRKENDVVGTICSEVRIPRKIIITELLNRIFQNLECNVFQGFKGEDNGSAADQVHSECVESLTQKRMSWLTLSVLR